MPSIDPPVKVLVMIFDARDEWDGGPLYEAIVRVLESHHIVGATVLSGVMGYGAHKAIHRKGLLEEPHDKPVTLLVIENEVKLRAALPVLRPMVAEGVFVMFDAELIPLP